MTPIQRPFTGYFPWLAFTLLIPAAIPLLVMGTHPVGVAPRIVAPLVTYALFLGGSLLSLWIKLPPFAVDLAGGTAKLGRHTVPISTIRTVWRLVSRGAGQSYLYFRFESTEGPSVRVNVSGRPVPGLTPDARRMVVEFIRAAPIEDPPRPIRGPRGWERASRAELLADLRRRDLPSLVAGIDEETLRADREFDGADPEPPLDDWADKPRD